VEEGNIEILEPPVLHGLFFNGRVSQRDHVALFIVRSFRRQRVPVHNREIAAHGFFLSTLFLRIRPPETLEEIAIRYASLYRSHGGGELRYIPALNDSPGHIKALGEPAAPSSSGLGARSAYLLTADAG
jgi:hypothetical protein